MFNGTFERNSVRIPPHRNWVFRWVRKFDTTYGVFVRQERFTLSADPKGCCGDNSLQYYSLNSRIEYGQVVWGGTISTTTKPLEL